MIDTLIKSIKGILPDSTWDFIFQQFTVTPVKFEKPPYSAVRVSKDYMLVKVEHKDK
jgi:hypothetical protein